MHRQACIAGAPPAWVLVIVGEERIFAGHDVSWLAGSEYNCGAGPGKVVTVPLILNLV